MHAGCHQHLAKPLLLSDAGRPNWRQLNKADLSATLNRSRRISLMLTALLIQAHADAHANTPHTHTQMWSKGEVEFEHLCFSIQNSWREKKEIQKDCRLEKETFAEEREGQGRQMDGIKQRRGEKLERFETLYIFIWQLHAHSANTTNRFFISRLFRTFAIKNTSGPKCAFLHIETRRYFTSVLASLSKKVSDPQRCSHPL